MSGLIADYQARLGVFKNAVWPCHLRRLVPLLSCVLDSAIYRKNGAFSLSIVPGLRCCRALNKERRANICPVL